MDSLSPMTGKTLLPGPFEGFYRKYNRREMVHPDPLQYVLKFHDPADQEIAGLIASGLAYGRVAQILNNLEKIFAVLGSPAHDLQTMGKGELLDALGSFRHRWTTGEELVDLLRGVSLLRGDYGSLENCFLAGAGEGDRHVIPALTTFVSRLRMASGGRESSMLACPSRGSACKRMFLYLRWMVRRDAVDPGPWAGVPAARLIVPMDVHMHRISLYLGMTSRRQADLKCALEVTDFFRELVPDDPVKYDFALTRPGIRSSLGTKALTGDSPAEMARLC